MKGVFLALLCGGLLLSGCKVSESEPSVPKAPENGIPNIVPYIVTDEGIFIYWESSLEPEPTMTLDRDLIDQWWIETQQCLGMEAEPPIVRITDDVGDICPGVTSDRPGALCISLEPAPIVLRTDMTFSKPVWDVMGDRVVWKHEFTHYIGEENSRPEFRIHDDAAPHWQCQWN